METVLKQKAASSWPVSSSLFSVSDSYKWCARHKWNHVYWTEWLTGAMMGSSSTSYSNFWVMGRFISFGHSYPPFPFASRISPGHPDPALLDQGKSGSTRTFKRLLQEAKQWIKDSMGDLIASLGFQPLASILSADFLLEVVTANYLQLLLSLLGQPDMLTLGVWLINGIYGVIDKLLWKSKIREIWASCEGYPKRNPSIHICFVQKQPIVGLCAPPKSPKGKIISITKSNNQGMRILEGEIESHSEACILEESQPFPFGSPRATTVTLEWDWNKTGQEIQLRYLGRATFRLEKWQVCVLKIRGS